VSKENANTWRTRRAVARYGPAARHAFCRAALSLWQTNAEWLRSVKHVQVIKGVVKDAKQNRVNALALVGRFRKAQKLKEVKQTVAILHKVNRLLRKAQMSLNQAKTKDLPALLELRAAAEKRFAFESVRALRDGNFKAFNALERASKRWNSGASQSDHRALGLLELLRKKALKAAWSKGGAAAGYDESGFGSDRVLSDAKWPQLTAREVHSHLVNVKAFVRPPLKL